MYNLVSVELVWLMLLLPSQHVLETNIGTTHLQSYMKFWNWFNI